MTLNVSVSTAQSSDPPKLSYKLDIDYKVQDELTSTDREISSEYLIDYLSPEIDTENHLWKSGINVTDIENNSAQTYNVSITRSLMYEKMYNMQEYLFESIFSSLQFEDIIQTLLQTVIIPVEDSDLIDNASYNPLEMLEGMGVDSEIIFELENHMTQSFSSGSAPKQTDGTLDNYQGGPEYSIYHVIVGEYDEMVRINGSEDHAYDLSVRNIIDISYAGGLLDYLSVTFKVNGTRNNLSYDTDISFRMTWADQPYPPYPEVDIPFSSKFFRFIYFNIELVIGTVVGIFLIILFVIIRRRQVIET